MTLAKQYQHLGPSPTLQGAQQCAAGWQCSPEGKYLTAQELIGN